MATTKLKKIIEAYAEETDMISKNKKCL